MVIPCCELTDFCNFGVQLDIHGRDLRLELFINQVCTILSTKYITIKRSKHRRCSVKKVFLKISLKFTGNHLCQSLFFNNVAGQKRLWHRYVPVNFAKFLRTPFFYRTPLGDCFYINQIS